MAQSHLITKTTGIKGGNPTKPKAVGEVTIREWNNGVNTYEIIVDCFSGSGDNYKRREKALINITFAGGKFWSGSFADLQMKLLDEDPTKYAGWCTEDIIERGKEQDKEITEEQAIEILAIIKRRHDANIGINWEVIDIFTDQYFEDLATASAEVN